MDKEQLTMNPSDILIAEFMGCKITFNQKLDYQYSWDMIMPVVEKIENIGYVFMIGKNQAGIGSSRSSGLSRDANSSVKAETKIEAVYQVVVQFIQWYNLNPKNNQK